MLIESANLSDDTLKVDRMFSKLQRYVLVRLEYVARFRAVLLGLATCKCSHKSQ